ncbi:MAG: sugar phosphate nucleotidyltransferase [Planctomycetota bacterium]
MRYAMIMAGGAGTRLWPVSRKGTPKQLVPIIERGDRRVSLLELSAKRLEGLVPSERRYICTNEAYRDQIKAALPEFTDELILGEPEGRDTVNAVGFAAAVLHARDPDAVFAVLTADHIIEPADLFRDRIETGFELVEADPTRLVTFSIEPTYPATGFGYVERAAKIDGFDGLAYSVERFVEKPSLEKAQAYLESGGFGWNSGMFVWSAANFMDCLRRYKPESHEGLARIGAAWDTPDRVKVLHEVYPALPKISVDYAVMEPATREQARVAGKPDAAKSVKVCTVRMDLSWLDVGSWPSYGETLDADEQGNRVSGEATLHDCSASLVVNARSGGKPHRVAVLGAENLIVVHTDDATLVMPAEKAQDLKALHATLADELK